MEAAFKNIALRIAIMVAAVFIASFGIVAMLIYLGAAIYLGYAQIMPAPLAALAAAGTALASSIVIVLIGRMFANRLKAARVKREAFAESTASAADLGSVLGRQAFEFVQTNKKSALVGAVMAGFAFGASPRFRSFLRDIVVG
jgi:hypothetical protein